MVSARKKVVRCKAVILATYPKGWVKEENIKVVEMEVDLTLKEGYITLKLAYISLDPYYRGRMQEDKRGLYFSPFQLGKPLHGGVVAKVIESANPKFQEGNYVTGILDFCEYLVAPQGKGYSWEFVPASQELEIVDVSQVPPSYYLGVCEMPGLTAYVELKEIGRPKPGEEVLVTAAAGAVGPVVGQLAKIYGCCVVSSAGSDLKLLCLQSMSNWINLNAVGNHLIIHEISNPTLALPTTEMHLGPNVKASSMHSKMPTCCVGFSTTTKMMAHHFQAHCQQTKFSAFRIIAKNYFYSKSPCLDYN